MVQMYVYEYKKKKEKKEEMWRQHDSHILHVWLPYTTCMTPVYYMYD
jgi:hypothetical protein